MTLPIQAPAAPRPLVFVLLALLGCGSDGSGPNGGPLTLDSGARVSRMVPAAGATLTTLAGDGTRYTLVIPAAAIRDSAAITMTPILAATGPLGDAGLVAGVRFDPEGLVFARPATLTIELAAGPAGGHAAIAAGDGSNPQLVVSATEGGVVTFAISHFSVAAVVASADAIPVPPPGAVSVAAQQVIMEALGFLTAPSADAVQTIIDAFHTWYAGSVRPKLQAAAANGATDVMLVAASSDYSAWLMAVGLAGLALGAADVQLIQGLNAEVVEGRQLAAAAFEAGIARNNALCVAQPANLGNALLAANNVLYWQEVASSYLLPPDYPLLQLQAVVDGLCLSVAFDAAAFPEQITVGQTYPLNVRVGYAIGGAAPILTFSPLQALRVEAQPVGAVAASAAAPLAGFTDGGATFATSLAVQQNAVVINVHACALGYLPDSRVARNVCTDTLVVRNGGGHGVPLTRVYTGLIVTMAVAEQPVSPSPCEIRRQAVAGVFSDSETCSSIGATGSAHASTQYQYGLTEDPSGNVTQLRFSGQGSADAASGAPTTMAQSTGSSGLTAYFDVVAPSGSYVVTGTLSSNTDGASQTDFSLTTAQGEFLECATTSLTTQGCTVTGSVSLSGTLSPGRYYIYMQTRADADAGGQMPHPAGSSSADFTIDLTQH